MRSTITIISLSADTPDELENMSLADRRTSGKFWTHETKSGVQLDTFFMRATDTDLGVYYSGEYYENDTPLTTYMIDYKTLVGDLPTLEQLVEKDAASTAKKLHAHGKQHGDLARITTALGSENWPTSGEAAEEAAAFARYLLVCAREGKQYHLGACWEYRGTLPKR